MQLATTVGTEQFSADSIPKLLRAASLDPDGFRLLFRIAAWEPDFREFTDALSEAAAVGRWEPWVRNLHCGLSTVDRADILEISVSARSRQRFVSNICPRLVVG